MVMLTAAALQGGNRGCRREFWHEIRQQHAAAVTLDDVGADDGRTRIIRALDQHVRFKGFDLFERRIFLEDHHEIDMSDRCHDRSARGFGLHRPALALQAANRRIAVQADDQSVAGRAGLGQQRNMSGVQQIEATVGVADL